MTQFVNAGSGNRIAATADGSRLFVGTPLEHRDYLENSNPYTYANWHDAGILAYSRVAASTFAAWQVNGRAYPKDKYPAPGGWDNVPDMWFSDAQTPTWSAEFDCSDNGRYLISLAGRNFQILDANVPNNIGALFASYPLRYGTVASGSEAEQDTNPAISKLQGNVAISGDGLRGFWFRSKSGANPGGIRVYRQFTWTYVFEAEIEVPFNSVDTRLVANTDGSALMVHKPGFHAHVSSRAGFTWAAFTPVVVYDSTLAADLSHDGLTLAVVALSGSEKRVVVLRRAALNSSWETVFDRPLPTQAATTVAKSGISVGGSGNFVAVATDFHVANTSAGYLWLLQYNGFGWDAYRKERNIFPEDTIKHGTCVYVTKDDFTVYVSSQPTASPTSAWLPRVWTVQKQSAPVMPVNGSYDTTQSPVLVNPTYNFASVSGSVKWVYVLVNPDQEIWVERSSSDHGGMLHVFDNPLSFPLISMPGNPGIDNFTKYKLPPNPNRRALYIALAGTGSTAGAGLDTVTTGGPTSFSFALYPSDPTPV